MKIRIHIIASLILLSTSIMAQFGEPIQDEKPPQRFWDKVYVGGNLGLQFGTSTLIMVSPLAGYKFTPKFSAGLGLTYQYFHYKDKLYNIETNVYGARVFARYLITDFLFAYTEYEYLNLEAFDFSPPRRVDVGSLLGGGGYIQQMGPRVSLVAMILYNFTESVYSPYQNPIIRIGVNIGL